MSNPNPDEAKITVDEAEITVVEDSAYFSSVGKIAEVFLPPKVLAPLITGYLAMAWVLPLLKLLESRRKEYVENFGLRHDKNDDEERVLNVKKAEDIHSGTSELIFDIAKSVVPKSVVLGPSVVFKLVVHVIPFCMADGGSLFEDEDVSLYTWIFRTLDDAYEALSYIIGVVAQLKGKPNVANTCYNSIRVTKTTGFPRPGTRQAKISEIIEKHSDSGDEGWDLESLLEVKRTGDEGY